MPRPIIEALKNRLIQLLMFNEPAQEPRKDFLIPTTNEHVKSETQAGEDIALRKLIREGWPPFLVDVGAHDGSSISNSKYFVEELRFKAVLIEPLPKVFQQLENHYAGFDNVTCLNMAITNSKGTQTLHIGTDGDEGMMSSLSIDRNAWFNKMRSSSSIKVATDTLTNILENNNFPNDFSLLLIDTEGMDYEVLCGLNFNKFLPRVIVTEEYQHNHEKHIRKYDLLLQNGYSLVEKIGCNTIWVQKYLLVTQPQL